MTEAVRVLLAGLLALSGAAVVWSSLAAGRRASAAREQAERLTGGETVNGSPPGRLRLIRARWPGQGEGAPRGIPAAVAAGAGAALFVGGLAGVAMGALVAVGVRVWQRRAASSAMSPEQAAEADRARRQLPLAADLLAACLAAGADPRLAAEAVGGSLGGPVGGRLSRVAAELRLGGDPALCWARFGAAPGMSVLARPMERACGSGAPPVRPMAALAAQCRSEAARELQTRARKAGVLATAPLGLCFLPAFLVVGVVPMVIGLAGSTLGHS
ncbi:type II secretion system F family protein [Wenjunlia tyrosinilytica]|jgi:hypothetical protein|uniref:Type II secretion system protein GspF domain-containing protein n=1 Tax=Wenjunlia tyrosinilytica TaxID=1544741 RepID=A0A917ZQ40_9ACTN|nr:type II secretion system F family protein [Wenjunlia tyrosinilytica]GGO89310.1 hypothetical protein GCM10012280_32110 [Wenjunlia tyrosinilytica]